MCLGLIMCALTDCKKRKRVHVSYQTRANENLNDVQVIELHKCMDLGYFSKREIYYYAYFLHVTKLYHLTKFHVLLISEILKFNWKKNMKIDFTPFLWSKWFYKLTS